MAAQKYFIAIAIPPPLFENIEAVKDELFQKHGLKGALRCPAHITLHRPFEWKEEKENVLIEKLSAFKTGQGFDIELKGFGAFEPRVLYVNVLQNDFLTELHSRLKLFAQRELKLFNEVNDLRAFHPHITIASRDLKKNKFHELWPGIKDRVLEGTFKCNTISLLKLEKTWRVLETFNL